MSNAKLTNTITGMMVAAGLCIFSPAIHAQDPSTVATPTPSVAAPTAPSQVDAMQAQIDLLKKQKELEQAKNELAAEQLKKYQSALKDTGGGHNGDNKNNTTFAAGSGNASPEVTSLTYEALRELSGDIEQRVHPVASQLTGLVIYNDSDFDSLAKYRIYKRQSDAALKNYDKLKTEINEAAKMQFKLEMPSIRVGAIPSVMSLPSIATGFLGDVGQLLEMFRSTTTITEWSVSLDNASLETAMANAFAKGNPGIRIFMPAAFTPEYDLESEGKESILLRVTDVNQAYQDVSSYIDRVEKLPPSILNDPKVQTVLLDAKLVEAQLAALAIGSEKIGGQTRALDLSTVLPNGPNQGDNPNRRRTDLEQLIRAEKLDRFLRQPGNVGILKVRVITSGGSRRQTSNLLFGDHTKYSGALTFEVLMFDLDGTVKVSDIFSGYTGFRKLDKPTRKPKP